MNYTENYHLPQWVKDDRIMMEDFNRMCENVEAGLMGNAQMAADANRETAEEAERRAFDRICRLAYNHYCFTQTIMPFPRQVGVFHQDTSASDVGITGMKKFEGYYQLSNGPAFDAEQLFAGFQQTGPMTTTNGNRNTPLTIAFTAPANGSIDKMTLFVTMESSSTVRSLSCQMAYTDMTTGETLKQAGLTFGLPSRATGYNGIITEQLCFHIGHQYRLTITPVNCYFATESSIVQNGLAVTCCATGVDGLAVHTFQNPDENLGLLVAAAYRLEGDADEAKLFLNGEEIQAYWYRDIADGAGRTVREAVFRRNVPVQDGDRLALKLVCWPGAEATLYNWGAVLL